MTDEVKVFETPVMTITKVLDYETANGFRYLQMDLDICKRGFLKPGGLMWYIVRK